MMSSPKPGTSSGRSSGSAPKEYSIRVPKNTKKKHHVMRYNATLNVDFSQWRNVKMKRENNLKEFRGMDEDIPKFGAGSEYNRELREEVRRKKYGIIAKRYKPEAQPWILKVDGKDTSVKKFRGIREGGVSENAAFYVFTHALDGAIEAYPLNEWYNFQPIQRYKALSAEEAEEEFGRRNKVMNYFSLMLKKRLKGDDEEGEEIEELKNKKGGGKKDLKISDMDEWIDSDEESDSDDENGEKKKEDSDDDKSKKKGKNKNQKKKKDADDEAFEESDDGDEEGRERDYISDSSESEPEGPQLTSVAEEDALRNLLTSDEDSDEEEKKSTNPSDEEENEDGAKKEGSKNSKDNKDSKDKKKKKNKKKAKDGKKDSSSDFSSDSSDSEARRSASPMPNESNKRKNNSMPIDFSNGDSNSGQAPPKKPRLEGLALPATFAGVVNANNKDDYGITEEAVRRYLMRKPMTTTELLTKFKNKKTGVSSEKLVEPMTQILKRINPIKQTIQGKMYLSLKATK